MGRVTSPITFENMRFNILILLAIIFCNSNIFSQKNTWVNYTTSQRVMDIEICDSTVWVATFGGLVKYNYYDNTKEILTRANANLPDNNIISLSFDNNGNLWLSTMYYGIGRFTNNWCINYYESNSGLPSNQWNTKIRVDAKNAIWIASMNYIVKFDKGKWNKWEIGNQISASFSLNDLLPDNNGGVWVANSMGLGKFENGKYSKLNDIVGPVLCLKQISKNKFWIGTQFKGLYLYDNGSLKSYNISNSTISTNSIISLAIDKQGNTWFPDGNKLIKYNDTEFITQQSINEISDDIIITTDIDNNNNVWCGTFKGNLYRFKDSSFEEINISNSVLRNNHITDLALNDTAIYISTNNNLVLKSENKFYSQFNSNKHISSTYISNIATSKLNDIWISFSYGDTCLLNINKNIHSVFDSTNSPFNKKTVFNDIVADSNIVWFATNNGLYSYSNYKFIEFKTDKYNIPSNSVLCLYYDSNNILWGGTDNGLFKFDGFSWQTWNSSNSPIPTDIVNCIYGSSDGKIWFACMDENRITGDEYGGGITVLNNSTMQTFNINNSPIPSNTIFDIYVDNSNNIWIGTCWQGLVKFNGID